MESIPSDIMGYDRAITVFSPDGRLLQVEYARKTVSQGATTIGMRCKDGVLLMADKRVIEKLIVPESIEKIYKIDDHIGATMSGLMSDGRVLIERAQVKAQNNKIVYGEDIDVLTLVKDIANQQQVFTQYGGARPYGVSILFAGVDKDGTPRLFMTEPSGIYFEYKATSIGEGSKEVNKILEKEYKDSITLDNAIKLGLKALKSVLKEKFNKDRIDVAVISIRDRKFKKLSREELEKYF